MKGATDQHLGHATVQLQRVRPEKNERRFYAMAAALDLFGEAILIRNWGRNWHRWPATPGFVR